MSAEMFSPEDEVLDLAILAVEGKSAPAPKTAAVIEDIETIEAENKIDGAFNAVELTNAEPLEFDGDFQSEVVALSLRDARFFRMAGHLIKPEYFENIGEATLIGIVSEFHNKFGETPSQAALKEVLKDKVRAKIIKKEELALVVEAVNAASKKTTLNADFVADRIGQFARHKAVEKAILDSVSLLERGKFEKIEEYIKSAVGVGVNQEGEDYDYFEKVIERTEVRLDKLAGKLPPQGITTGYLKLNEVLYHRGWGKKELTTIMGGAKSGKTTALIGFAKSAALAGHNVLYVTLEVSSKIIAERLDASLSDHLMKELEKYPHDIESKVKALQKKSGKLKLREFASGTCTPRMLDTLIDKYKSEGLVFDLLVVDYADIMAPNHRTNDPIENSKTVYVDLRALAFKHNLAVLTATQTNREGYKATVAKAEHVSDDFNKVRTVDLMISINSTEEERLAGEARLYFAASRNQESGFTIHIKQDLARMKFIESIVRIE